MLRILNGAGEPISQAEIGRKMLSSRANVTKLLDSLEERKFVRRLSCEDRRVNLVELTDEGAKFLEETAPDVIGSANEEMRLLTRVKSRRHSSICWGSCWANELQARLKSGWFLGQIVN